MNPNFNNFKIDLAEMMHCCNKVIIKYYKFTSFTFLLHYKCLNHKNNLW